jgi:hypothetical protein
MHVSSGVTLEMRIGDLASTDLTAQSLSIALGPGSSEASFFHI